MFHPDYLGGGFSATFVDVTITGDLDFGSASVQSLFLGDNTSYAIHVDNKMVFIVLVVIATYMIITVI